MVEKGGVVAQRQDFPEEREGLLAQRLGVANVAVHHL